MIRTLVILTVAAIVFIIEYKLSPKVFATPYDVTEYTIKAGIVGWVIGVIEYVVLNSLGV